MSTANLFDMNLNLTEAAREDVSDVLLNARRISLSTDADIQFYCVIAQDTRFPQIQLVIVRYVDDIKRAHFSVISLGESQKRMLVDINENPQAKKENAIREVFGKMEVARDMQEKVLDDFFRSPPSTLEGIGYWDGKFYIKNITLQEFMAQQMANRIKIRFREKDGLAKYNLQSVKCRFVSEKAMQLFLATFRSDDLLFIFDANEKLSVEKDIFSNAFVEIATVIYNYKFNDFNSVEMVEQNFNKKLSVQKDDIYLFKKGKLGLDLILEGL